MEPPGTRWSLSAKAAMLGVGMFVAAVFALLLVALYMVTHLVAVFGGFCC